MLFYLHKNHYQFLFQIFLNLNCNPKCRQLSEMLILNFYHKLRASLIFKSLFVKIAPTFVAEPNNEAVFQDIIFLNKFPLKYQHLFCVVAEELRLEIFQQMLKIIILILQYLHLQPSFQNIYLTNNLLLK